MMGDDLEALEQQRDGLAQERDRRADEREREAVTRQRDSDFRELEADLRDAAADAREEALDRRSDELDHREAEQALAHQQQHAHRDLLSSRQRDVIALVAAGKSNEEVAQTLYVTVNTVKTTIRAAYRKMGVTSRAQAVAWYLHGDPARDPD